MSDTKDRAIIVKAEKQTQDLETLVAFIDPDLKIAIPDFDKNVANLSNKVIRKNLQNLN